MVVGSVPFVLGFTAFFVLLGVGAALVGGRLFADQFLLERVAGFVLVVLGLAFMGLLPWPERLLGAGLVQEARSRGSRVLLGGAFAICAAPCIGPVLAGILVLAGSSDTVVQGGALLGVYSLGLAVPFVLAGALFTRAMGAFRWLRDHYRTIQVVGGALMVALGLLLFFERFYVLRVYLNRFLQWIGLLEPATLVPPGGAGSPRCGILRGRRSRDSGTRATGGARAAGFDEHSRAAHVLEHDRDVDLAMPRRVRVEATRRLLELSLAARSVAPAGLVPGDGDVDEPLQERALVGRSLAPLVLELLVRLEVGACPDQLESFRQAHGAALSAS